MRKLLIAFAAAAALALAGGAEAEAQYGGRVVGAQFNRGFVPGYGGAGFGVGFNRGFVPRRPVFVPRPIFAPRVFAPPIYGGAFIPRQRFFAPAYGAGFAADPYCPPGAAFGVGRGFNLQFSAGY
jgi:hypothetical protein